jgi:hypothetical protein
MWLVLRVETALLDVDGSFRLTDRLFFTAISWQIGLPSGLHPGATPANPVVQEVLILWGFLEAFLKWRRGRDSAKFS